MRARRARGSANMGKRGPKEAALVAALKAAQKAQEAGVKNDRWVNVDGVEPDARAQYVGAEISCRMFRGRTGHGGGTRAGYRTLKPAQLAAAIAIAYQLGKEGR